MNASMIVGIKIRMINAINNRMIDGLRHQEFFFECEIVARIMTPNKKSNAIVCA
jgi:hypothetical protein